ncbi:uncharacterized protein OCT59_019164 [Rhizophagus irregularis]|uniref:F-box domain-containing protein n=2 Tax=Rhizophagus irregularis TaxID=588596 RepID=A0A015JCF4_RHIIW|nr:hypothetical protein RirG_116900 [Rhizophagus irregularis DAOM 197198w]PKY16830.1 hypothetical protein RhiirB3_429301 [Rhizophagus irregularis]UZO26954.1 hypothetical protein OCT59_019164 [Rhizophagus irregularis]GBC33926.1 hypothetical protein GLOIN_2v1767505 [Rhizophagus irregularis DAOM 181602=DAOM 197198]
MSCSKVFSGDLPELIYEIIKYFQKDYSTLHSCILVNRLWCRLAIPLLWENPFSIPRNNFCVIDIYLNDDLKMKLSECKTIDNKFSIPEKNYHISDIYFKTKLNEYKIINNSLLSNTLFNYPKFLKYLNTYNFILSVELWLRLYSLRRIDRLNMYVPLLTIFFENEVNLHTLEIENINTSNRYSAYVNMILEVISQNTNFIQNIRNLKYCVISYHINENPVIKDRMLQIIHSHQNLKKILINKDSLSLFKSLLSSNIYNCSNTLNTIIFYYVNFKRIINLDKIFEQLNVLESIHIIDCSSLDNNFTQQIINLTKPFKLKSLFISKIPKIESLDLLLQKSCNYLENFRLDSCYELSQIFIQQLFELIIKYCKNIKLVDFDEIENQFTYQVLYLIENIQQNLNYLSICTDDGTECSSIILQNLGQILPPKLEYLCLELDYIKTSDFEVFLKNSQNTFIKKLIIHYDDDEQDILPSIKKYIMKKKRVKYLAINEMVTYSKESVSLMNEVKRFELYNIKVQDSNILEISAYDYIIRN